MIDQPVPAIVNYRCSRCTANFQFKLPISVAEVATTPQETFISIEVDAAGQLHRCIHPKDRT